MFQSTLPRRERQQLYLRYLHSYRVSIHAPAKGATPMSLQLTSGSGVSIHAPAKGATFFSTFALGIPISVSIHAPAKGATLAVHASSSSLHGFNPRSREGSDQKLGGFPYFAGVSIHAPAKGATIAHAIKDFVYRVSIHAPAKGATRRSRTMERTCSVSIHAPAKGATWINHYINLS